MTTKKNENTTSLPFMYVEVPQSSPVNVNMQNVYISSKDKKEIELKKQVNEKQSAVHGSQQEQLDHSNQTRESIETDDEKKPEEKRKHWQRKPFRNMQIGEKIEFLLNKPAYLPNTACEIKTDTNVYVGVIKSCENNEVTIKQTTSFEPVTIAIDEIIYMNLRPL